MSANSSPEKPTNNYLIVGNAGVGKTTVIRALVEMGHNARDLDEVPGACGWLNSETGEQKYDLTPDKEPHKHTEWHWSWVRPVIEAALNEAPEGDNFWAGSARNQREFYDLFDGVFALVCSVDDLGERLNTRTTNDYGKEYKDYISILSRHGRLLDEFEADETQFIDTSSPRTAESAAWDIIGFVEDFR